MNKDMKKLIKIIQPHCKRIVYNSNHIKAFPNTPNSEMITISTTSADFQKFNAVRRDFRRNGINLPEWNG